MEAGVFTACGRFKYLSGCDRIPFMGDDFRLSLDGGNRIRIAETQADDIVVLYVPAGEVCAQIRGEEYRMQAGDVIAVNRGDRYSCGSDDTGSFLARLEISADRMSEGVPDRAYVIVCNTCRAAAGEHEEIRSILRSILRHYMVSRGMDDFFRGYCYLLLHYLRDRYLITVTDSRFREQVSRADERAIYIRAYVEEHYSQDISLNDLAEKLHLALSYLSRFSRKVLGMTFTDYVNMVRLRHATVEFARSEKSVTRIAMENGFSNITTFNRAFKKHYGMAPTEYRLKIRNETGRDGEKSNVSPERADGGNEVFGILQSVLDSSDSTGAFERVHEPAPAPENAASDRTRTVRESVSAADLRPMKRPWNELINVGRLADLKDNRMRSEIARINSSIRPHYVRIWNVLTDEVNLGTYKGDRVSDYDFGIFDSCIDFLLQNHIKPYLNLGFNIPYDLRQQLVPNKGVPDNYIGSLFHFGSYREICGVLRVLLQHIAARYGEEEAAGFRFGLWYPNLYYDLPGFMNDEDRGAYAVYTYRVIREVLPEALIGAADFSLLFEKDRIFDRIQYLSGHGVKPDFVTCVSYPYRFVLQDGEVVRAWQIQSGFMRSEISSFRSVLEQTQWNELPLWITEYNFTLEQRNYLNDIRFKGAYILKNMTDVCDVVDGAGYYMLSDIYSEWIDTNRVLFGGCGILNKNGISKPSYFALYFLSRVRRYLCASSENYLLSADGRGNYTLIVHNFSDPGLGILMKPERSISGNDLQQVFDNAGNLEISLRVEGLEPGWYHFRRHIVDAGNGDLAQWLTDNQTTYGLDQRDISYLQQTCMPKMNIYTDTADENGELTISCLLAPNDFAVFEFSRRRD